MENIGLIHSTLAAGSTAPKAEIPAPHVGAEQIPPIKKDYGVEAQAQNQEHARFEAVKRAAKQIAADDYPISDVRFTIYKETTDNGDFVFVTLFTSLRDGKVTVVPEPKILSGVGKKSGVILETLV